MPPPLAFGDNQKKLLINLLLAPKALVYQVYMVSGGGDKGKNLPRPLAFGDDG